MKENKNILPTIEDRPMGGGILGSKRKNPKRRLEIIISLVSITILLAVVSFSYAYIKLNKEETEVNVVGTDCISLEMIEESNAITIQNTFPVSDEVGKKTPPYVFKLKNECGVGINYEIQLEVEEGNTMEAKNVATMVDNKEKIVLTSEQKVKEEETSKEKYKISETLTLEPYKEVEHKVRIWLDKDADNESQNKKFLSKVIIEAVQNQSVCTYESKWEFDYTNNEQIFTVPCDGVYLLEVWGAQGGTTTLTQSAGGLGGYSKGEITLETNDLLYINVGGQGEGGNESGTHDEPKIFKGGYNGGGNGGTQMTTGQGFGGGGATHIAKATGLLAELEEHKNDNTILIVAGGGGGNSYHNYQSANKISEGGSGGGYRGTNGIDSNNSNLFGLGATQIEAGDHNSHKNDSAKGAFGLGGNVYYDPASNYQWASGAGGGGGYYGGGGSSRNHAGAGGGSGYIGNTLLTNKGMWCYECEVNNEDNLKTTSTTSVSKEPISEYAKQGNGFARITYLRIK